MSPDGGGGQCVRPLIRAPRSGIGSVDPSDRFRPTGRNRVLDTNGAPITGKVRLFAPPPPDPLDEPPQDFTKMPGGTSGITFFDVTYRNAADVPRLIAHRTSVRLAGVDSIVTELTDPVCVRIDGTWPNPENVPRTLDLTRAAALEHVLNFGPASFTTSRIASTTSAGWLSWTSCELRRATTWRVPSVRPTRCC